MRWRHKDSKGGKSVPRDRGADVYAGLREQILRLDPATAGMSQRPGGAIVWGALMEMGYPNGVATIVALADGTTSMYTSSGGGIIGGGGHRAVVTATHAFLESVADHLGELRPDPGEALPAPGQVIIRALTYLGRLSGQAPEDDLGNRRHSLAPVFYAGQEVITQLRLIDEARTAGR
jgi:hypothetical protein